MPEAIGWAGIIMAIAAMIRGEVAANTARKVAREKAEGDRLAARDKLEFDVELLLLQKQNTTQAGQIKSLEDSTLDCEERYAHTAGELDRCKEHHRAVAVRLEHIEAALEKKTDRSAGHTPPRSDPD
jgi:chromosome segregation ATPase